MNDKVLRLVPNEVSEEFRFDGDQSLENMKGEGFDRLLIIGQFGDGTLKIEGNCNAGEALVLMEVAKHKIVFDDD